MLAKLTNQKAAQSGATIVVPFKGMGVFGQQNDYWFLMREAEDAAQEILMKL
jgi:hypothetical protein